MNLNEESIYATVPNQIAETFIQLEPSFSWMHGLGLDTDNAGKLRYVVYPSIDVDANEIQKLETALAAKPMDLPGGKQLIGVHTREPSRELPPQLEEFELEEVAPDESSSTPIQPGKFIYVSPGGGQGTLGLVLQDDKGRPYAATCAHVVVGWDGADGARSLRMNGFIGSFGKEWSKPSTSPRPNSDTAAALLHSDVTSRVSTEVLYWGKSVDRDPAAPRVAGSRIFLAAGASGMLRDSRADSCYASFRPGGCHGQVFTNVIVTTGIIGVHGDSGSLAFDPDTNRALGILFQTFLNRSLITDLENVLADLDLHYPG